MSVIKLAAWSRRQGIDINFGDLALRLSVQGWYDLLVERSRQAGQDQPAEPTNARQDDDGARFGLATMQHGYWIGRPDGQALGGGAAHLCAEFDGAGLDMQRLERAVARLMRSHGMPRSQFLDDGTQRILDRPGVQVWSFANLPTKPAAEVAARLDAIRDEKTQQRMPADPGKVFDVSLTLLPGGWTRLHMDVDMLAADALSYWVIVADLVALYLHDSGGERRLIDRAHRHGLTPAVVLASGFAEVVGRWSSEQPFLPNVPLSNREPVHLDVENLVGDFSSSVLIEVDITTGRTILGRARRLQHTLHSKVVHADYPYLDVLRGLDRSRGEPVLASVVYTSGLMLCELFRGVVLDTFGEPGWIISQGPQVVLDAQVVELKGGLMLNWDVREHAFPAGLMDAMFARNREIVDGLLTDEADWVTPLVHELSPEQAKV